MWTLNPLPSRVISLNMTLEVASVLPIFFPISVSLNEMCQIIPFAFIRNLLEHKKMVILGSYPALLHNVVINANDIDVFVFISRQNMEKKLKYFLNQFSSIQCETCKTYHKFRNSFCYPAENFISLIEDDCNWCFKSQSNRRRINIILKVLPKVSKKYIINVTRVTKLFPSNLTKYALIFINNLYICMNVHDFNSKKVNFHTYDKIPPFIRDNNEIQSHFFLFHFNAYFRKHKFNNKCKEIQSDVYYPSRLDVLCFYKLLCTFERNIL